MMIQNKNISGIVITEISKNKVFKTLLMSPSSGASLCSLII